jgi:uncharacterized delta-60 repeat protein
MLEVRSLLSGAGSLDPTFGSGGVVTTAPGTVDGTAYALALESDGKIVAAGDSNGGFTVARYTPAGALDTSFNKTGDVALTFDRARQSAHLGGVAVDGSGRIVVAGVSSTVKGLEIALARLNSNGSLDTTFGTKGMVLTAVAGSPAINALVIQPDGKLLVAGWTNIGGYSWSDVAVLARYNANGTLDRSFGQGGVVTAALGAVGTDFWAVALQSDGRIVAGGEEYPAASNNSLVAVARFNPNGSLDTSFGSGGQVTTSIAGNYAEVHAVLVQSDGRIVAAGTVLGGTQSTPQNNDEAALVRYDASGNLDPSFGTGGITVTPTPESISSTVNAAALQSDGRIITVGEYYDSTSSANAAFEVERYTSTGVLDTSFNGTGIVTTPITSGGAIAEAVVIQPTDGKIVAAGYTGTSTGNEFALARYLGGSTTTTATAAVSTQAETTSTADRTVPVLIPLATGSDQGLNLLALEWLRRTRRVRVASELAPLLWAR